MRALLHPLCVSMDHQVHAAHKRIAPLDLRAVKPGGLQAM